MKRSSFWFDALTRWQQQWETIVKSYQQHPKTIQKLRTYFRHSHHRLR